MFGFDPSPEQVRAAAQNVDLDNDDVQQALLQIAEDKIRPRLDEIKERSEGRKSSDEVRAELESLPDDKKTEVFHQTWAEIITACAQLRVQPVAGMKNLKAMIRDPWTVEAMLLMMEVADLPSDIEKQNKDLMAQYITWMGSAIAPEMYDRAEVEDMIEQFGADPELLDKWDENNVPDDI